MLTIQINVLFLLVDVKVHLCKHLMKTLCQDIVNLIFEIVAAENLLTLGDDESFNSETRLKVLNRLSGSIKGPLTKLNSSLGAKVRDIPSILLILHTHLFKKKPLDQILKIRKLMLVDLI